MKNFENIFNVSITNWLLSLCLTVFPAVMISIALFVIYGKVFFLEIWMLLGSLMLIRMLDFENLYVAFQVMEENRDKKPLDNS